ncbi:MAG: 4-(cytidine 5'-diphospho)-2-C-methyl-D-erythritol kinase [Clostridiales bacterium]|nr:4-(cytidine 5'-diphospho)-2-C-methyl-D-erythritol kinase [Clostridiales bacterium]
MNLLMKKVNIKAAAKINLTLDVEEKQNNFHPISSLVTSISVYDYITITKREDRRITLKTTGIDAVCKKHKNNAYLAAKLFRDTYNVAGVDIIVDKHIPVGAGLGGSSADIAGVLKGMRELFGKDKDILSLANALGSDSGYMIDGGLCRLSGRGDIITPVNAKKDFYVLIISDDVSISAKECYALFDKAKERALPTTDLAIKSCENNQAEFYGYLKNDLYPPALILLPRLKDKIKDLDSSGAIASLMTGSGSAVYGLFKDEKALDEGYNKLKDKYKDSLIKAVSV